MTKTLTIQPIFYSSVGGKKIRRNASDQWRWRVWSNTEYTAQNLDELIQTLRANYVTLTPTCQTFAFAMRLDTE